MFAKGELHLSFYLCELLEMSVWSLPVPAIVFQPELAFDTQRRRNTQGYSVSLHETPPQQKRWPTPGLDFRRNKREVLRAGEDYPE